MDDTEAMRQLAHDLRTPLTTILGYAELIEDGDLEGAALHDAASVIHKSADQMRDLLNRAVAHDARA